MIETPDLQNIPVQPQKKNTPSVWNLRSRKVNPQMLGPVGAHLYQRLWRKRAGLQSGQKSSPRFEHQRGQAMTEYLIIVALIAVAAIAVYQSFGQVIRAQTAGLARELAGESANQAVKAARTASDAALKQKSNKSLKSYGASQNN